MPVFSVCYQCTVINSIYDIHIPMYPIALVFMLSAVVEDVAYVLLNLISLYVHCDIILHFVYTFTAVNSVHMSE